MSKYFRKSLGLRDIESRMYINSLPRLLSFAKLICEMWLFFHQFYKSDMSRYRYVEVF